MLHHCATFGLRQPTHDVSSAPAKAFSVRHKWAVGCRQAPQREGPDSMSSQSIWDLWCTDTSGFSSASDTHSTDASYAFIYHEGDPQRLIMGHNFTQTRHCICICMYVYIYISQTRCNTNILNLLQDHATCFGYFPRPSPGV
jgi:hypothetical protein